MKILVVEDEPASLKLAHLVLADGGYEVADATAAENALDEIMLSEPEVILLDLALPGIDGLTLARCLKRNPKTQHIPIIAITAFPENFPREAAMAAGCDGYIVKPINTRKLPQQIAEMVENAK